MEPVAPATYDDRVTIATPEGVDLTLTLAGVGSRFASAIVDIIIQSLIIAALTIVVAVAGPGFGGAVFAIVSFVVVFGYDVAFEVLASGRTPGKRMNGLRVVRSEGQPVDLVTSVIRNLLRIVDFLPASYLVGIISIVVTDRNQRLGDLAAGTLVVRERREGRLGVGGSVPSTLPADVPALDVSAITPEELNAVRSYLGRRQELSDAVRRQLAHTMAERLRPKVGGLTDDLRGERFLESLVAAKRDRE
jgi:uncharacterized RDD family membrane protein YckC